jgi:HTH-type transcriptional regulator / antitoxin MqsA
MTIDMSATRPHACGGTLRLRAEPGSFHLHGSDVPVTEYFWRCDVCGEEFVTDELAHATEQEAAAKYRQTERRLSPDQILALRQRFGLTQDLMERALGLGAKTWVRWEAGRVLPNRSMDNLLRLIERDPTALRYLAELHGVEVPAGEPPGGRQAVGCSRWPRTLMEGIEQAAISESTTADAWLVMTLTQLLFGAVPTGRKAVETVDVYREADWGTEEPWQSPDYELDDGRLVTNGTAA